jgi:hypothetical protein
VGIRHRRRQPSGRGPALAGAWTAEAGIAQSVPGVAANRAGAESAVADDNDGDEVPGLGAWLDQRCDEGDAGEGAAACRVPLRPARALREPGDSFLYTLKAGLRAAACGGRPRAGNPSIHRTLAHANHLAHSRRSCLPQGARVVAPSVRAASLSGARDREGGRSRWRTGKPVSVAGGSATGVPWPYGPQRRSRR